MTATSQRSILLIDADPSSRTMCEAALATLGAPIVRYANPSDAVAALPPTPYALIVLSVDPTDFRGLAAVMRLREVPAGHEVPLIAILPAARAEQARVRGMIQPFDPVACLSLGPGLQPELLSVAQKHAQIETVAEEKRPQSTAVTMQELRDVHGSLGGLNYYERLGVTATDDAASVRRAFMKRVQRYRPEAVELVSDEARRMMRGIHDALGEAYATLRDPARRKSYEERLARKLAGEFESSRATLSNPTTTTPNDDRIAAEAAARAQKPPSGPRSRPYTPPKPPAPKNAGARWAPPASITSQAASPPASVVEEPAPDAGESVDEGSQAPAVGRGGGKPPTGRPKIRGSSIALERELQSLEKELATPDELDDLWSRGGGVETVSTEDKLADAARLRGVMGDYAGAVELMEQAILVNPDNPDFKYKLELYKGWRAKAADKLALAKRHFMLAHEASDGHDSTAAEELKALGVSVKDTSKKKQKTGLGSLFGFGKDK